MTNSIKRYLNFVQINLHHCKSATALLARALIANQYDVALIQEPYLCKGKVKGLDNTGGYIHQANDGNIRTCIYVRHGIHATILTNFCHRDLTTIKLISGEGRMDTLIASAYLPYEDKEPVTPRIENLVKRCSTSNEHLIMGCDANAHHVVWGSTDNNTRGEKLLDYVVSSSLIILNKGNRPTFVNARRAEVLDITMTTRNTVSNIENWHVSNEISLSDHRYICFRYMMQHNIETVQRRNPRNTNWKTYYSDLKVELGDNKGKLNSIIDLEFEADRIERAINKAWTNNCPEQKILAKKVPWWNSDLDKLRKVTRKAFNIAKARNDFSEYARQLTEYNKAVRKAKRQAWKTHCESIESVPAIMRITKAMAATKANPLMIVRDENGKLTETGKSTLEIMFKTHFPGSIITDNLVENLNSVSEQAVHTTKQDWETAKKIVDEHKIKWALSKFQPYKSPGPDDIYPILLQRGLPILNSYISRLYKASIAFGYTPKQWRLVKVVFIPKPGKDNYEEPKSFRPISLSSFLLKVLEKLLDRHIREGPLIRTPLHRLQCAYQQGKSTETALHHVVKKAEMALENKEVCVGIFIDIEGAFDRTTFEGIDSASKRHGIEPTICRWIQNMLRGRIVISKLLGEEMRITTTKGCPQGGVLSPLLWSLVVDSILTKLNVGPYKTIGYADDLVILVNGKFVGTTISVAQKALGTIEQWCNIQHLSINPSKTTALLFTKKRDLAGLTSLKLFGSQIQWSTEVKYLGVILDKNLTWRRHVDMAIKRAIRVFAMCRSAYGRTWGLKPTVMRWIYDTIVAPMLMYGSIVWWPRTKLGTCKKELAKLQRLACMSISGAFRTTPTAAMEVILNLKPLHVLIEIEARKSLYRLQNSDEWFPNMPQTVHTKMDTNKNLDRILEMCADNISTVRIFKRNYNIYFPLREEWKDGSKLDSNCQNWFTDGSKMISGTGAGIHTKGYDILVSMGHYPTVFQAELYAIIVCAKEILDRNSHGETINILSDSQAALKALSSYETKSGLVLNCVKLLNKIGRNNRVRLAWVPGHTGIEGNERADELARKGSETPFMGPEPFIGIPSKTINNALKEFANEKHTTWWSTQQGLTHSKKFIGTKAIGLDKIWKFNKTQIRLLVGIFSGHYTTYKHLYTMGIRDDPRCRFCSDELESMQHLLCQCDARATYRLKYLQQAYPEPESYRLLKLEDVLKYVCSIFEDGKDE